MTSRLRSQVGIMVFVITLAGIHSVSAAQDEATFTTYAGLPTTGTADGTGSAARFSAPRGAALDGAGNIFVADSLNFTIRQITPSGVVTTFAGVAGSPGSADGTGSAARFRRPGGLEFDAAGNLYVADTDNHTIRMITPAGAVTTVAGTAGNEGSDDGIGAAASFSFPEDVALDSLGNVYVSDNGNATIRKITPAGVVSTFAGTAGQFGSTDGTGAAARFRGPFGLAVDSANNLFVGETNVIRKITPAAVVTTFAGTPGQYGNGEDGTGSAARFSAPRGIAIDGADNLYVGDEGVGTVRKITPAAVVTTFAGMFNRHGHVDGNGSAARFLGPNGVAANAAGTVFVAEEGTGSLRVITPARDVTTLAGAPYTFANTDGPRSTSRFGFPAFLAFDATGNLYVTQGHLNTIRKISPLGAVATLAGTPEIFGSADGTGSAATFADPVGIGVDSAGNLYVADSDNETIRKITPAGVVTTLAGAVGMSDFADGTGSDARFHEPIGVAVDSADNVYVADSNNNVIRKITPAAVVTTFAGSPTESGSLDGTGDAARFRRPLGLAIDSDDNLYVADGGNTAIRKITSAGVVTTVAGMFGNPGTADGTGSAAQFLQPFGVAVDGSGNLFVTDGGASTIRKVTPAGVVTTIAGTAGWYSSGDGTGAAARFAGPVGIAVGAGGALYVADSRNNTIRKSLTGAVGSDYDGDGTADLVIFRPPTGEWYIKNSTTNYTTSTTVQFGLPGDVPAASDYDGDGQMDLVVYRPSSGTWFIHQSSTSTSVSHPWGLAGDLPVPGDYDGDGKMDPAVYRPSTARWYVLTSSSNYTGSFVTAFGARGDVPVPGDYDGDGTTDVVVYRPGTGEWFILESMSDFATEASFQWGLAGDVPVPSDYDGDGRRDLAVYRPSTGTWYITQSTSNYATSTSFQWGLSGDVPAPNSAIAYAIAWRSTLVTLVRGSDFDADRQADLTVYRPSTATWHSLRSSTDFGSSTSVQWGLSGDLAVPHDYDGDGQTDVAVFRPSSGEWHINTGSPLTYQWGLSGDLPVPGDYDGDGKSDAAVYRPSTGVWHLAQTGSALRSYQWGLSNDVPVPGDYDGDARTDLAVYRPSTGEWFIKYSVTNYVTSSSFQWGLPGDISVPGEYDGDGKTDLAVYRPSTGEWFVRHSSTGYATSTSHQWGLDGDVPVPADFDGDRKTDLAVWRPSTGVWYLLRSSSNFTVFDAVQWGLSGDSPILKRP